MEIKRALLLFLVVLGMAAIVSAVARQPSSDQTTEQTPREADPAPASKHSAAPRPERGAKTIEIPADANGEAWKLEQGRAGTVIVHVEAAGQVEIPSLGLVQSAEPLTPARFDVLVSTPGVHPIRVRPASPGSRSTAVADLRIVAAP